MPNTHWNTVAALAADSISDQLREQLEETETLPAGAFDTSLARRDDDGTYVVELVRLAPGAKKRSDGVPVLRIRIEAL